MSQAETISHGGKRLAVFLHHSVAPKGLSFLTQDSDFVQVGLWSYDQGQKLQAHVHNEVERKVSRTQEVLLVKTGRVAARIFDNSERLVKTIELGPGDVLILLDGGHGYDILEDGTSVVEVKNGPYPGAEADRRRIGG